MPVNGDTWAQNIQYVDTVRKEISDRDIYIIALQTNLMSSREEIDVLKKKYDNLMVKNDELQKILEEVKSFYFQIYLAFYHEDLHTKLRRFSESFSLFFFHTIIICICSNGGDQLMYYLTFLNF
jgi:predicted RNase H-like nuclease (RuvC/YqgF family)